MQIHFFVKIVHCCGQQFHISSTFFIYRPKRFLFSLSKTKKNFCHFVVELVDFLIAQYFIFTFHRNLVGKIVEWVLIKQMDWFGVYSRNELNCRWQNGTSKWLWSRGKLLGAFPKNNVHCTRCSMEPFAQRTHVWKHLKFPISLKLKSNSSNLELFMLKITAHFVEKPHTPTVESIEGKMQFVHRF